MRLFKRPGPAGTVIVALAAALALAGCGRKSGLDLPPSAAAAPAPAPAVQPESLTSAFQRPPKQQQPAPPKRDLPIDVLLN